MSATVDVRIRENGSGVVRVLVEIDASALKAVESGGVPLEQAVRLDDLTSGGWDVGPWVRAEDGSATITLAKPFDAVEQVADIVTEGGGQQGPLREVEATRESGFLATEYSLTGDIDLESVTTGLQNDPELLANLTAQSVDPAVIDQQLLAQVKASFALDVVARLPGSPAQRTNAKPGAVTSISSTASVRNSTRLLFLGAAALLALLAIVLWFWRPRKKRPKPTPRTKPGPRGGPPRQRVPRPHLPEHMPRPHLPEHMPRPHLPEHLPHPHLPRRSRPDGPPPPPRKPPMIPPGMT